MGKDTTISWADHTFNPWVGCTKVSRGCDNCYAETYDKRAGGHTWGTGAPRRRTTISNWMQPRKWNDAAEARGEIASVFCLSLGDINDPEAPAGAREDLWHTVNATPWLLWLLLTKRPHLYTRYLPDTGFIHDNVMLGVTAEGQPEYDERIGELLEAGTRLHWRRHRLYQRRRLLPPVKTFVSYEPALGPITMGAKVPDWLIFGGETGGRRRPMDVAWAETIKAECETKGVLFFMKQMSATTPAAAAGLIPAHLLVQQFPILNTGEKV